MTHTDETRGQITCAVEVSPDIVDAGAELTVVGKVSCSPARDLRGHTLLVSDGAGAEVGRAELTTSEAGASGTGELVLTAPREPGDYTWSCVCPAVERDGVSYAEAAAPVAFTVTAHATNVVVWDVPPAIVAGERFTLKVGIRCSSECRLANRRYEVHDHDGREVAAGMVSGDLWPGTTGLYVADVALDAPLEEGLFAWSVRVPSSDLGVSHAAGAADVGVRVVGRPACLVTVEAIDGESQAPVAGARVVMHPYRAVTDDRGIAELRVTTGAYRLFVSQTSYLTFGVPIDVTADTTARAELHLEPVPERN